MILVFCSSCGLMTKLFRQLIIITLAALGSVASNGVRGRNCGGSNSSDQSSKRHLTGSITGVMPTTGGDGKFQYSNTVSDRLDTVFKEISSLKTMFSRTHELVVSLHEKIDHEHQNLSSQNLRSRSGGMSKDQLKPLNSQNYFTVTHTKLSNSSQCSQQYGEVGNEQCLIARIKFSKFDSAYLLVALATEDANPLVRRISIDFRRHSEPQVTLGEGLDLFLGPRPWWYVLKETTAAKSNSNKHKSPLNSFHVLLIRQSQMLEPHVRLITSIQFAPEDACSSSRLRMGHMLNSGWGAQTGYYGRQKGFHPWTIFNVWDSYTNLPSDGVPYADKSMCPNIVNKRLCAFLPITNCSMPDYLTTVKGDDVVKLWPVDIVLYTNSSKSAVPLPGNDEWYLSNDPQNPYQEHLHSYYLHWLIGPTREFATSKFIEGKSRELTEKLELLNSPAVRQTMFAYGLLMRPTALYRSLIQQRIDQFRRDKDAFPPDVPCVAMHIRRGDRNMENVNMTEFCGNITKFNDQNCTNREGQQLACWRMEEFGCFTGQPFGALRLQDYLDRAQLLVNTRNIFVMTDDAQWLAREKAGIDPSWRVGSISGSRTNSWASDATQSGVDFLASIALAKQCQGFVGHWGSSVAHVVFRSMCIQHAQSVGQCPLACNIGGFD